MSVQFGRWHFDENPRLPDSLKGVDAVLAPYGPDNSNSYQKDGVCVLYRAFDTTKESRNESQPLISESGNVITWDGRLDNRAEFVHCFSGLLSISSSDVSIVAAAYDRWGTGCLAKLVGDWAVSIWKPNERALILAKDPIGTRHLYYSLDDREVRWCTILDPLVMFGGRTFAPEEEYVAGWLSFFPAAHLSPYAGIDSVAPSNFVRLERRKRTICNYWDFDPSKRIRYRTDAEYEEHFRSLFAQAVKRRLRSDRPILAELSGGMDSSSIVCMADTIITQGAAETPRLDTLSCYNDSEPNWNERPYFTKVEEKRGRVGYHIDVGTREPVGFEFESDRFRAMPGSGGGQPTEASVQFATCLASQGNRVVLSGIGGDEVMGGVPTSRPELMDLLATLRFRLLARQLKAWALSKRKPWFHLLFEALRGFFPPALVGVPDPMRPPSWLDPGFINRQRVALTGYSYRVTFLGPLPSFQENVSTLDLLRRQLACFALLADPPHEKCHPYLDRDLLEFMFAVPREQLVRPGQRRSLMRRALIGIVPDEILGRKRKAYVARAPLKLIPREWPVSAEMAGILEPRSFSEALRNAHCGRRSRVVPLLRALALESWLRNLTRHGILAGMNPNTRRSMKLLAPAVISAEKN